ncbi:hypothetical protein V8E54_000449 [Elaphomyces granulatus]
MRVANLDISRLLDAYQFWIRIQKGYRSIDFRYGIRGHLIKRDYGLDCDEQSEYFLFSRFRLVDSRFGLGKVSSFVATGENVLRVVCILRESRSGIGFLVAEVFEAVSLPEQNLEGQVKRYRSVKQYKLLQPSAVQTLLSVQHVYCARCTVQDNHRNAFRREREWVSGDKWVHAENDEWISQERAAQHEIDKHLQSGLQKTLKNELEKKRRQRGERLNLLGEEDFGAQLFHSSRVRAALAYEAEKEARVAAEKAEKEAKKAQAKKTSKEVRAPNKSRHLTCLTWLET